MMKIYKIVLNGKTYHYTTKKDVSCSNCNKPFVYGDFCFFQKYKEIMFFNCPKCYKKGKEDSFTINLILAFLETKLPNSEIINLNAG